MQFGLKDLGSVSLFFSQMCESKPILSGCTYYKYHNFPCNQPLPLLFLHPTVTNFSLLFIFVYYQVPVGGSPAALSVAL